MNEKHRRLCRFYGINQHYDQVALEQLVDVQAEHIAKLQEQVSTLRAREQVSTLRARLAADPLAVPPRVREG